MQASPYSAIDMGLKDSFDKGRRESLDAQTKEKAHKDDASSQVLRLAATAQEALLTLLEFPDGKPTFTVTKTKFNQEELGLRASVDVGATVVTEGFTIMASVSLYWIARESVRAMLVPYPPKVPVMCNVSVGILVEQFQAPGSISGSPPRFSANKPPFDEALNLAMEALGRAPSA